MSFEKDTRPYVKLALELPEHAKYQGTSAEFHNLLAIGICAMSLSSNSSQTWFKSRVLQAAAMTTPKYIRLAVSRGILHGIDHDCDRCPQPPRGFLVLHDYARHQTTVEERQALSEYGKQGAARRWGKKAIAPPMATPIATPMAAANSPGYGPPHGQIEVEEEAFSYLSSQAKSVGLTLEDMTEIATRTRGDLKHAERVVRQVLENAAFSDLVIRDPKAYIFAAINNDPKGNFRCHKLNGHTKTDDWHLQPVPDDTQD